MIIQNCKSENKGENGMKQLKDISLIVTIISVIIAFLVFLFGEGVLRSSDSETEAFPNSSHTAEIEIDESEQVGDDTEINGSANPLPQEDSYNEQQEQNRLSNYSKAVELYNAGDYLNAQKIFLELGEYQESISYLNFIGDIQYEVAQNLMNNGDYEQCAEVLEIINEEFEWYGYQQAIALRNECKDKYLEFTYSEAYNKLISDGYDEMEIYLDSQICTLLSRDEAKNIKSQYSPMYITDMEIFDMKHGDLSYLVYNENFEDKFGNRYSNSLYMDSGSVSFYVNQDYAHMCGTVACPKGTLSDAFRTGAYITLYGDDQLLYRSELSTPTSYPQNFEIDISDISIIKIVWESEGSNIWLNWGYMATLYEAAFYKY